MKSIRSQKSSGSSHGSGVEIQELEPFDVAGTSSDDFIRDLNAGESEEKIYVAVGKVFKEGKHTLEWVLQNFPRDTKLVLVHVHCPAQMIPTPLGKLPASQLTPLQVNTYRLAEKEKMNKALDEYLPICANAQVQTEKSVIDMDDVGKGLLTLITEHGITKLVMGAAADKHYSRKMKAPKSKTALLLQKEAPQFCGIWFICKGRLICTRNAEDEGRSLLASPSPSSVSVQSVSSGKTQIQPNRVSLALGAVGINRSWSSAQEHGDRREAISELRGEEPARMASRSLTSRVGNNSVDVWAGISRHSYRSPDQSSLSAGDDANSFFSATVPRYEDSDNGSVMLPSLHESEEDSQVSFPRNEQEDESMVEEIYGRLKMAFADAERSKAEAYEESRRRQQAERSCLEAIRRVKVAESAYARELKLRKDVEEILEREELELDNLRRQLHEITQELSKAHEQKSVLETQARDADRLCKGLEEKLSAAQNHVSSLQAERDELRRERDDAVEARELLLEEKEELKVGVHGDQSFSAFTFSELDQATNGFDRSLKVGEGGYGTVYKGVLRHTTVAVKKLCAQGCQGQQEFYREVEILSRVRHPNLVMLIGACVEDWCLIYEFLPNGSLEDRLLCKGSTPPLSWQARIRIATEICSALVFLHSHSPQRIVHGDLKPANILLDANFVSKLSDFGLSRLLVQSAAGTTTLYHRTDPKGTFAYMDPEFFATGELTPGSDVYSFGVIVLQLLTGKPALGLPKAVLDALNRGNLEAVLDKSGGEWPFVQAKQLAHLGLRCCEVNRKGRPDLVNEVWRILEPMRRAVSTSASASPVSSLEDDSHAPSYFICPIFQEVMRNPHVAADGFTYEAEAIKGWIEGGNQTSPMTNLDLPHCELIPNHALRSAIQEWLQRRPPYLS